MEKEKIKVLIVDDSALMRSLISRIVDSQDDMTVIGKAMNGAFALQKIPMLNPDIIVLDLEMPEMNGMDFLKEKEKQKINIPVIVLSSIAQKGAKITFEALSSGASDFLTKPSGEGQGNLENVAAQLCSLIRAYSGKLSKSAESGIQEAEKISTERISENKLLTPEGAVKKAEPVPLSGDEVELIAIGISTGGPNALRHMLSNFDKNFKVPIVIVQHMPVGFTAEFAKSLGRSSSFDVKEAEDEDLIIPGRILIAPGNRHISVDKRRLGSIVRLNDEETVNGHRPSAGVLFNSAAAHYSSRAMGIIMTGMGKDGSAEIGKIYNAGGFTIAQDEESSVVFGMPRVAIEKGFIRKVLPLKEIAGFIMNYVSESGSGKGTG